jgi:hypothetical protein
METVLPSAAKRSMYGYALVLIVIACAAAGMRQARTQFLEECIEKRNEIKVRMNQHHPVSQIPV